MTLIVFPLEKNFFLKLEYEKKRLFSAFLDSFLYSEKQHENNTIQRKNNK